MKTCKRIGALLLALILTLSLSVTGLCRCGGHRLFRRGRGRLVCGVRRLCPGQWHHERHQRHHL